MSPFSGAVTHAAETAPAVSTASHHHRDPPRSRSRPTRNTPYTPRFTIAALINAVLLATGALISFVGLRETAAPIAGEPNPPAVPTTTAA